MERDLLQLGAHHEGSKDLERDEIWVSGNVDRTAILKALATAVKTQRLVELWPVTPSPRRLCRRGPSARVVPQALRAVAFACADSGLALTSYRDDDWLLGDG